MKTTTIAALAATIFSITTAAFADVSKKDQKFFTEAAGDGMYEVEAGKLAQSKGKSEGVKSFGGMLVKDHGAANDELKALAAKKGAALPPGLPADKQNKLDKLSKAKDCGGQVISDSEIGFFDVDLRSKALGDKLPSFECSLRLL